MIYVFGVFLIFCGAKMALEKNREIRPGQNPVLKFARRFIPISGNYDGNRFFTKEYGKLLATPLFLALLAIESSDLLFAMDSVPAVLGHHAGSFYCLYLKRLCHARTAVAVFRVGRRDKSLLLPSLRHFGGIGIVGVKMLLSGIFSIPTGVSLLIILGILTVTIIVSQIRV